MGWIKVTPETMPHIEGCPFMITAYSDNVIVRYLDGTVDTNRLRGQSDVTEIQEGKDKIRAVFVEWDDLKKLKVHGDITHWMLYPEPAEDLCEFCISYNSMKEHMKKSCTGTFLECAIVEETTLFGTGNKKFPLWIIDKNGPRDFNGFQLNFCPECGKKLLED